MIDFVPAISDSDELNTVDGDIYDCMDNIHDVNEFVEEGEDINMFTGSDKSKKKNYQDAFIRRGGMLLIKQEVNADDVNGYANPYLSDGLNLNQEVYNYKNSYEHLRIMDESGDYSQKDYDQKKDDLNRTFQLIAGYYSNYEHRWFNKMSNIFPSMQEFKDFYYDLLRDCLLAFDFSRLRINVHDVDFRKADSKKNYFNQYFYSALNLRLITYLKKTYNTSKNPSVTCEVCGEKVTKLTDFHLSHTYDVARVKKMFKEAPMTRILESGKKEKYYDECPICHDKNVPAEHIKEHHYAESYTVNDYVSMFPKARLSGVTVSFQSPVGVSGDTTLTLEDVFSSGTDAFAEKSSVAIENIDINEHIDHVFKDDPFSAKVLKLKCQEYSNKEIAMKVGDTVTIKLSTYESVKLKNKNDLYNFIIENNMDDEFFEQYGSKFGIIKRRIEDNGDYEVFLLSSCSESKISSTLIKIRKNSSQVNELLLRD